jgi:hypothetical protein
MREFSTINAGLTAPTAEMVLLQCKQCQQPSTIRATGDCEFLYWTCGRCWQINLLPLHNFKQPTAELTDVMHRHFPALPSGVRLEWREP